MAETTEISWAHSTFNPWIGCTRVSPGCDHCYAATIMDTRYGRVKWGAGEPRQRTKTWDQPRAWNRKAKASGEPWRVFCASLADVFDNEVDPAWRRDLFNLISDTPALTWMLLTKRVGNVYRMLKECGYAYGSDTGRLLPLPSNIWLGITVVNQAEADRDIPDLLKIPAAVRWLSCEPLLGPLDLSRLSWPNHPGYWRNALTGEVEFDAKGVNGHPDITVRTEPLMPRVGWVIVGGESGINARPMDPAWARGIRDQCAAAGVPFHFKQWGPRGVEPLLDGREHKAFPISPTTVGT